jgi:hypothetical protein
VSTLERACAILPSVACPAVNIFSTLSNKQYDFGKQVFEHKMFVFSTSFVRNISHSEKNLSSLD